MAVIQDISVLSSSMHNNIVTSYCLAKENKWFKKRKTCDTKKGKENCIQLCDNNTENEYEDRDEELANPLSNLQGHLATLISLALYCII
jgi:hypothetical protein